MSELEEFIRQHATPYDPDTDTYCRPPFAQPVKAGKNSPIYNAHSYHTKVPPEGIVPYIEHYTDPGDLILDPFCGSGMTGVAALMTGRHAILNDLSPAAVHIARNYCTPVDVEALRREFERIKAAVKEEFDWLYGTTCDRCGGPATIQYTIWSDVFECARCGNRMVFWDVAVDKETAQTSRFMVCPRCCSRWLKSQLDRLDPMPVQTDYECTACIPGRFAHPTTSDEMELLHSIEASHIPYWHSTDAFDVQREQYIRDALHLRHIQVVADFYHRRAFWALARLWEEIGHVRDYRIRDELRFVFTSMVVRASNRSEYREGGGAGNVARLTIPPLQRESNVLLLFERKMMAISNAAFSIDLACDAASFFRIGSASELATIPGGSIDYVFTDPPFGMNIYYSDLKFLWEVWLRSFTNVTNEAVVHRAQKSSPKSVNDYGDLMAASFGEMYRVLKPGRWASVVFHNSDDRIWQVILDAAEAAGFELAEINAFDKTQLSFKGIRGAQGTERVTNQDIVLNLRKPRPTESARPNGRPHVAEAEQRVVETVADFLAANPPPERRTLQHLWNHVLHDMLRQGSVQVSMAEVQEMLAYHYRTFKLVDGRYYLRGEAVMGGNAYALATDAGAIAWLSAVLSTPQTTGDLIPKWQQETANLNLTDPGRLDRLLEQNFWLDKRTGRWREPNPREREQMSARADLSAEAHLRVVRRFLAGQLERRPDDREFYAEAVQLFDQLAADRLDAQDYREVKRMAAVSRVKAGPGGRLAGKGSVER